MITVTKVNNKAQWKVALDKKLVGHIHQEAGEFFYQPKGSKTIGEKFPSLNLCIKSLED